MRPDALVALAAVTAASAFSWQCAAADDADSSPVVPRVALFPSLVAPVSGADQELTGSAVDLLAAAVTAKTTGTEFRVTAVPISGFDVEYVPVLSDATLVLLTDTSSSLTRFAVSLPYNPFSLRSRRVASIIKKVTQDAKCSDRHDNGLANCLQQKCGTLAGTGANAAKLREACTSQCRRDADREETDCDTRRLASEWRRVNDSWIPLVSMTASADFYPYGSAADVKDPAATGTLRWWGGFMFQAASTFRKWERGQVDVWGTFRPRWRGSGAADAGMARYVGGGVSASWLVASFVDRHRLDRYPDYAKSGVLPGVALGASAQGSWCTEADERCANGRTRQLTATPYFDLRINSQLLLRFAVPLNWYRAITKDGTDAAPTFTLAGTIGPG